MNIFRQNLIFGHFFCYWDHCGRAPVVVDEKYIACPEFSSGMYINLYANDTKFELKGKLEGGHDYLITALILSGENVVSSGWDETCVMEYFLKKDRSRNTM